MRSFKTKNGPASRQQDSQVDSLENKPAPLQNLKLLVYLFLIEDKALEKEITEIMSKDQELWNGREETIIATHHTIMLKERTRLIR